MTKGALRWALLALATREVIADDDRANFGGSVGSFEDITDADWAQAFHYKAVNASASATFPGRNISAPYPGSETDDWRFDVFVAADVPISDGEDKGKFRTGTWLKLYLPDSLVNTAAEDDVNDIGQYDPDADGQPDTLLKDAVDPSWGGCTTVFLTPNFFIDEDIVSPDCSEFLSESCIKSWKTMMVDKYKINDDGEIECYKDIPPGCRDKNDNAVSSSGWFNFNNFTADAFTMGDGSMPLVQFFESYDIHEAGNDTAYKDAIRRVNIISHVWGYSNKTSEEDRQEPVTPELLCLRTIDHSSGGGVGVGGTCSMLISIAFITCLAILV